MARARRAVPGCVRRRGPRTGSAGDGPAVRSRQPAFLRSSGQRLRISVLRRRGGHLRFGCGVHPVDGRGGFVLRDDRDDPFVCGHRLFFRRVARYRPEQRPRYRHDAAMAGDRGLDRRDRGAVPEVGRDHGRLLRARRGCVLLGMAERRHACPLRRGRTGFAGARRLSDGRVGRVDGRFDRRLESFPGDPLDRGEPGTLSGDGGLDHVADGWCRSARRIGWRSSLCLSSAMLGMPSTGSTSRWSRPVCSGCSTTRTASGSAGSDPLLAPRRGFCLLDFWIPAPVCCLLRP
jgi:hypothetical protein